MKSMIENKKFRAISNQFLSKKHATLFNTATNRINKSGCRYFKFIITEI